MKKTAKASPTAISSARTSHWGLPLLGLGVLGYVLFFLNLGGYPLFDMDEPRYAEAAREMIESGNWITPYFNYELRFDKPVFFYWLIALAYQAMGVSEFSARFFSAVSAFSVVLMVFFFGRHWVSTRFGLFAAAILATSIEVIGLARMSVTDMTLSCFMAATTLCLFMVAHQSRRWWIAAAICSGLAILTKGPVGIVVPGAILFIYAALTGQFKKCFATPWFPVALVLTACLALPWYVAAYMENGQIFIDALFKHNVTRYNGVVSGHDYPVYFFVLVLLVGFLPWTAFLPASVHYWWNRFKAIVVEKPLAAGNPTDMTGAVALYGFIWTVFIFLFFTAAQTKLLTYILPLFPGIALFMGASWYQLTTGKAAEKSGLLRWFSWSGLLLVVALLVVGSLFVASPEKFLPREAKHLSENPANLVAVSILVGGTALAVWNLFRKQPTQALTYQVSTMALLVTVAITQIVPQINQAAQGAMISYLKQAGETPLVTYEITRPSLTYYARKKILRVPQDDRATLEALLKTHPQLYVVTKNSYLDTFWKTIPASHAGQVVESGKRYTLVRLEATDKTGPVIMEAVTEPSAPAAPRKP
jgi:4-amino-4-deoxy-L-arabinose transferase-like glycosyltransferase